MKLPMLLSLMFAVTCAAPALACDTGLYRNGREFVAITKPAAALRYTFDDGRRGEVEAPQSTLRCESGSLYSAQSTAAWTRVPLKMTPTKFESHNVKLSGTLIQLPGGSGTSPLVTLVHGSERTPALDGAYPYILASKGIQVFAYDKRGTGQSQGEYTQNFELLADDAAAALAEARRLAAGRYTRSGYYGGSQGGWVAPLAATRIQADFVAVGFGLLISPAEEDREQVLTELRERGVEAADLDAARTIADATARLVSTHFEDGFEELAAAKARYSKRDWFSTIRGEYSGEILKMSEAELRRVGRARFDNLELIWNYDSVATLSRLKAPLLWVLAEDDREAPPDTTLKRLAALRDKGAEINIFSFPDTDHGMVEFSQASDGGRTYGRITEGYFALIADWIKGAPLKSYGRARRC